MPRAPRKCPVQGCEELIRNARYCEQHTREKSWSGPRTESSKATSTTRWKKLRRQVLDRDGHLCQIQTPGICTVRATHVDKVRAAARGGDVDLANLRASCASCNQHKGRTADKR